VEKLFEAFEEHKEKDRAKVRKFARGLRAERDAEQTEQFLREAESAPILRADEAPTRWGQGGVPTLQLPFPAIAKAPSTIPTQITNARDPEFL
jgi:hypothetical protein